MKRRVTIMVDNELDRKIREYQAKTMLDTNRTYSYSDAINDLLARGA